MIGRRIFIAIVIDAGAEVSQAATDIATGLGCMIRIGVVIWRRLEAAYIDDDPFE